MKHRYFTKDIYSHNDFSFLSDDIQATTNGVCYTSVDSPSSPNQRCMLPFRFDGRLTQECLPGREGKRWCSTKVDDRQEHIPGDGNWGYCSPSCNGSIISVQSEKGATFSEKKLAWKGESL